MLILSRRRLESIRIGEDILITVLEVEPGGQVRLGIEAPRTYRILREELLASVVAENRQAVAGADAVSRLSALLPPVADDTKGTTGS